MLWRAPRGVRFTIDDAFYAEASAPDGFVSACGARIDRIRAFRHDELMKKPFEAYLAKFISDEARSGSSLEILDVPEKRGQLDFRVVLERAGAGTERSKIYFSASRRYDVVIILVYEAAPADFDLLLPSFRKGAGSIIVIPPDWEVAP